MNRFKPEIRIIIDNQEFHEDFTEALKIGPNLDEEMESVAGYIGWAGSILGAIKEEYLKEESDYKYWRANFYTDILKREPKLAEWKVKSMAESSKEYLKFKHDLAELSRAEITMNAILSAFKHKSELLRSRGAISRAELSALGMNTKVEN